MMSDTCRDNLALADASLRGVFWSHGQTGGRTRRCAIGDDDRVDFLFYTVCCADSIKRTVEWSGILL
jgi:hypothetical protein